MEKKKPTRNLLDEVSPEDLAKLRAHKASTEGAFPVDMEWLIAAEWLRISGWGGYMAFREDKINLDEVLTLIEATRKLDARKTFEDMQSAFVGAVSAQTKKPVATFRSLTKDIIKKTRVKD